MSKAGDHAYSRMREMIASGALAPGERLREEQLAVLCEVSRTPVREALRRLEAERYVVRANGATFVREWTVDDLRDLCEVRALLEGYAAEKAAAVVSASDLEALNHKNLQLMALAKNRTEVDPARFLALNMEFHELIWMIGLPSQAGLMRRIFEESAPFQLRKFSPEIVAKTFAEHEQVIQALQRGDARLARDCISTHIRLGVGVFIESAVDRAGASTTVSL